MREDFNNGEVSQLLKSASKLRSLGALLTLAIFSSIAIVLGSTAPALADPACKQYGAYVLFARGSGETLDDKRAKKFQEFVMQYLANGGVPSVWGELGKLDNNYRVEGSEYPATAINDVNALNFINSVNKFCTYFMLH